MRIAPLVAAQGRRWPRNLPGPLATLPTVQTGGRSPIDFGQPGVPLRIRVYLALGADLTADPSTWAWTDITNYVLYEPGISTTTGRRDESPLVIAGISNLTLNGSDGRFSRKNRSGPYHGRLTRSTPILVTINAGSSTYNAVEHFVNEWPLRWDKTQTFFSVPIQCGGILRHLQQGEDPLHSTEYRAVLTDPNIVVDYWPLEDGPSASSGANAIAGGSRFRWTKKAPTTASAGPAGSQPLWAFDTDTDAVGIVRADWPGGFDSTDGWGFQFVVNMKAAPTLNPTISLMPIIEIKTGGSVPRWRLTYDLANLDLLLEAFDTSGARVLVDTLSLDTWFFDTMNVYDKYILFTLAVWDDGAATVSYDAGFYSPDDVGNTIYYLSGTVAGRTGQPTSIRVPTEYATRPGWIFGHFAFFDGLWLIGTSDIDGLGGYAGETALARMRRVCAQEGVRLTVIGDQADQTPTMGPQPIAKFLDILRQCETVDGGVLCEKSFGLAYLPLANRYNAPYALELDIAAGHIAGELTVPDDDQRLRNHWEVSRGGGGSTYTASDAASIASEGKRGDSKAVNVQTDDQLRAIGEWLLFNSVNDDLRYPSIPIGFHRPDALELIDLWILADFGARVKLSGLPAVVDSERMADLVVEGKTEWFDQFRWTATLTTSSGRVYNVMVENGTGNQARVGPTQTLVADLNATDTTFTVATAAGRPLMALTASFPDDYPYSIILGDEQMVLTDVTGGSSPQTVTVIRSANGVVQSHGAGDQLGLYQPAVIGR